METESLYYAVLLERDLKLRRAAGHIPAWPARWEGPAWRSWFRWPQRKTSAVHTAHGTVPGRGHAGG